MLRLIAFAAALAAAIPALPAAAQERLSIMLDWFVNPDHATLIVAQERGYFADAGLAVTFKEPADPNDPPKLVAAGREDIAISYQPQLHLQAASGLPLVRIATLVGTPLNALVVLQEGPIKSLADLKGKKIGFSVGGFEDAMLRAMLARHGLGLKDITLVNVNFSLSPALVSGQVDGVIGAFRNFELNQLDILKRPGRAFYVEEEGVPAYDELIAVVNRSKLSDPRMKKFVAAIERGVLYLLNHPDDSWQLFIKGRKQLDDELNKRAWRDTLRRFAHRPAALDHGRYERFAGFLKEQDLIKTTPPLGDYAVELR